MNPLIQAMLAAAYEVYLRRDGPRALLLESVKRFEVACAAVPRDLLLHYGIVIIVIKEQQDEKDKALVVVDPNPPVSRM